MMRGRDAIAVALRHPDGRIVFATERLDSGFHGNRLSRCAVRARARRPVRDADRRHPLADPLRRPPGGGRGRRDRQGQRGADARHHRRRSGIGLFFILPLVDRHVHRRQRGERAGPAPRRGPDPGRHLPRLPRAHRAHAGHHARVPVPRRRAHDDPRARARRPARPRARPQVPDRPPALRHGVPGRRDPALDHRVQPRRPPAAAGHDREPDPAHPGDRRRSATSCCGSAPGTGPTRWSG